MSDRRAVELSVERARALGLLPPEHTPLATPVTEDVPVAAPAMPARDPIRALRMTPPTAPPSRAFAVIDAAFCLSGAIHGAPVIDYDARAGAYRLLLAKRLRLGYFTATERAATTIAYEVETPTGWKPLSTYRLPKYSLTEFARWLLLMHGGG